jgi:hypothetical protein
MNLTLNPRSVIFGWGLKEFLEGLFVVLKETTLDVRCEHATSVFLAPEEAVPIAGELGIEEVSDAEGNEKKQKYKTPKSAHVSYCAYECSGMQVDLPLMHHRHRIKVGNDPMMPHELLPDGRLL